MSMRSMRLKDADLPSRPDFGTVGQAIKLLTNFFPVNVPRGPFHEYDMNLDPPVQNRRLKRRIFQLAEQTDEWKQAGLSGRVAHDHSAQMYAPMQFSTPLVIRIVYSDEDEDEEHHDQNREPKEYTLTIKYTQQIDTQGLVQ